MKIIQLTASNVKRIKAVDIKPDGAVIQITGKNGSGKSSTLDCIEYALAGGKHLPAEPVRRGAKGARIKLDLGEVIVTRKFTAAGGTSLVVEGANGARFPSPQRMLDDLLGAISFDPLAFSRMDARGQFDMLRSIVNLDVDLDALAGLNKRDFEERTEVNRGAKAFRAQADGVAVPNGLPSESVNVDALLEEMERAAEHNSDIERRKAKRENAAATIRTNLAQADHAESSLADAEDAIEQAAAEKIAELEASIKRIKAHAVEARSTLRNTTVAKVEDLRKQAAELQAKLDAAGELPEPIDVASVRVQFEQGRTINAGIEKRALKAKHIAEAVKLEEKSKALTDAMETRDKVKDGAIQNAKMPIDGITFGDELVLYNGLPFAQASSAEQLRVSVAIAMAANPKLKVLRIKDGGLLDEDGMKLLADMAEAADYQVWIETVHANGPVAVEMVDGAIVGAPDVAEEEVVDEKPSASRKAAGGIEQVAGPSAGAAE